METVYDLTPLHDYISDMCGPELLTEVLQNLLVDYLRLMVIVLANDDGRIDDDALPFADTLKTLIYNLKRVEPIEHD